MGKSTLPCESASNPAFFVVSDKVLGEGTSGQVHAGLNRNTGETVAVKIMPKKPVFAGHAQRGIQREISILETLKHDGIVRLFAHYEDDESVFLVFQHAPTDLLQYVLSREMLSEEESRAIFKCILEAVSYMHAHGIVHRDLKLENFLVSKDHRILLSDFGMATRISPNKRLTRQCGTLTYSAPEITKCKPYCGISSDIWSLGVVLYCLLCRGFPFYDSDPEILRQKILAQPLSFPAHVPVEARNLVRRMLCRNPQKRASWAEITKHSWLRAGCCDEMDVC